MEGRLKDKVVIVTGAGSVIGTKDRPPIGNGKAAAILYAREGAKVLAVDVNLDAAEETAQIIKEEGGTCSTFRADVSNEDDCQAIADECMNTYGRIDILHNNVGIAPRKPGGILEVDSEDWDLLMSVNLKSMFLSCKAVVPQMLKQKSGTILNISSVGAEIHGYTKLFIYGITKAGINTFTKFLAFELADKGIRVNAIMPGMIDSPIIYNEVLEKLHDGNLEKMRKDRNQRMPMKHMGEPWDIAYASLFLVSDEAKYITGQILAVDGGLTLNKG